MPTKHSIPFESKLHAVGLIEGAKYSFRQVSSVMGVAKSTLHDNLSSYRKDIIAFEQYHQRTQRALAKDILLLSFEAKTSSRGCAAVLSRQKNITLNHQKVLSVLTEIASTATKKNKEIFPPGLRNIEENPLSKVKCAAFDEIFQKKLPILGFVDPVSAFVYLEAAPDRTEKSWTIFLEQLKVLGLDPESTVTDGGRAMLKSISGIFPSAARIRDLFHVLQKFSKAMKALEGCCYRLIVAYDKSVSQSKDQEKQAILSTKMNQAILLFDALSSEGSIFQKACYFENDFGYVNASQMRIIISRIVALIDCAGRNGIKHRCLQEARSYFNGAKDDIAAYKASIEKIATSKFGCINQDTVLGYICPIIEFLDQIQRSYENRKRADYWTEKLSMARKRFRQFGFIDQEEVDKVIDSAAEILRSVKKSNSLIENVNSVVRQFLVTYKSIPSWFCPIFNFYWNHKRFARGKRKGLKPKEILTSDYLDDHWIDALLKDHTFSDEKYSTLSEIPVKLTA